VRTLNRINTVAIAALMLCLGAAGQAESKSDALKQREGKYEISLRLPPDGLHAGEEMELEFHLADMSQVDPVLGPTPLIRGVVHATIGMAAMPGMPKFQEQAHAEGIPGDYGVHPTFAHGGEYQLHVSVQPLAGQPFSVEFPLRVGDAQLSKSRKKIAAAYRIELVSNPKTPKAGEPAELQLTVRGRDNAKVAVMQFDMAHERLIHLLIVREDLGTFAHEHPVLGEDGTFRLHYTFPSGGEYRLFADVAPRGAGSQVLMAKLKVSGNAGAHYEISRQDTSNTIVKAEDLTVKLQTNGPLPAMKTVPITFELKDTVTGQAPSGMEPYLGAAGHLLMVGQDGITFVHAHPNDDGQAVPGTISFLARLPKPGLYRTWAQFQRNGTVHTVSFIIEGQ
jgi:hypothetical protein